MSAGRPPDPTMQERLEQVLIGPPARVDGPIELADYDPTWPDAFADEAQRIRAALGRAVVRLEHVGSTSVPGMPAKPIIDMLLVVEDSGDERDYAPALEAAGYVLRVREPDWHQHRLFKGPRRDVNLHVFSAGSDEATRMLTFRDHLRDDAEDHARYERVKRELAAQRWTFVQEYADAKSTVVAGILARANRANARRSMP